MGDLVSFLLARIEEDEQAGAAPAESSGTAPGGTRLAPARARAAADAKRQMVEEHRQLLARGAGGQPLAASEYVLRTLAAAYAHHPDYRDEWRPEVPAR